MYDQFFVLESLSRCICCWSCYLMLLVGFSRSFRHTHKKRIGSTNMGNSNDKYLLLRAAIFMSQFSFVCFGVCFLFFFYLHLDCSVLFYRLRSYMFLSVPVCWHGIYDGRWYYLLIVCCYVIIGCFLRGHFHNITKRKISAFPAESVFVRGERNTPENAGTLRDMKSIAAWPLRVWALENYVFLRRWPIGGLDHAKGQSPFRNRFCSARKWCSFETIIREQKTVPLVNHPFARVTPAIFVIFVVSRGLSTKTFVLLVRTQND